MSNEIQIRDLTPVSFDDKNHGLSVGQQHLMKLLIDRIKDKKPITQQDIVDLYFKIASKNGETIRVRWGLWGSNVSVYNADKNSLTARARANQWFKNNLGACIIKGKLLAIPVIDIEPKPLPQ